MAGFPVASVLHFAVFNQLVLVLCQLPCFHLPSCIHSVLVFSSSGVFLSEGNWSVGSVGVDFVTIFLRIIIVSIFLYFQILSTFANIILVFNFDIFKVILTLILTHNRFIFMHLPSLIAYKPIFFVWAVLGIVLSWHP